MKPFTPLPRILAGTGHRQLIHRILRPDLPPDTQRIDLVTTSQRRVSIIDSGRTPENVVAEGDTAIHILWQLSESGANIAVEGAEYPVAPGDTVMVPGGDSWRLSANTLAVVISVRSHRLAEPILPTHGTECFHGYNRETRYPGTETIPLTRWKITQPLTLEAGESERILVSLYSDIAMQHANGVGMLPVGTASVTRGGQITLVPNGLSYVLVID